MNNLRIDQWKADPVRFIETTLFDPETSKPFKLLDAEKQFLAYAFKTGDDGRLLYPEQCYAAPKKSGKTGFAALYMLTILLLFGEYYAEGYALANDQDQAQSRVFQAIRRIVEASPLLKREARITADKIVFASFHHATITAVANDYAGMAGSNPTISCFDELWGFTSENSRRLWDEMIPPPTRKITVRLTCTYAGFSGESVLLEELYARGMAQPEVAPNLHAGDGILMAWHHAPVAPWQTEAWLAEMRRSLRPNQFLRMIENYFVTSESSFVNMAAWDQCVDPTLTPIYSDNNLIVDIGVDASVKHDSTAIVVVAPLPDKRVQLVTHRIFQPSPDQPLNFEATIEATLIDLCSRFAVRRIFFDPYQMQATAQRLQKRGLPIREFAQSVPNLTIASQNLWELIESHGLVLYPDAAMRLAASRAIAVETSRGWKIAKEKNTHKIDVIVALGMAAHAATKLYEQNISFAPPIIVYADGSSTLDTMLAGAQRNAAPVHDLEYELRAEQDRLVKAIATTETAISAGPSGYAERHRADRAAYQTRLAAVNAKIAVLPPKKEQPAAPTRSFVGLHAGAALAGTNSGMNSTQSFYAWSGHGGDGGVPGGRAKFQKI